MYHKQRYDNAIVSAHNGSRKNGSGPQQAQSTYCTVASLSKNRCRAETTLCERRHDQDAVRRQQVADPWNSIMDEWPA